MSDLPQRLRLTSFPCCQEAADRIEALEAALATCRELREYDKAALEQYRKDAARAALAPEPEK